MGRAQLLALIGLASLVACKETTIDDRSCPPEGTKLTYDNFGKAFMESHCQRCHGSADDRNGAPEAYDFGRVEDVRRYKARIFSRAAADNTTMPPGPDDPPERDREQLAEWLVCGAP